MRNKKYTTTKKRNKCIRKVLPNPLSPLKELGILGRAVSIFGKKLIKKPAHYAARSVTGMIYHKGIDDPADGSNIYTIAYIIVLGLIALGALFIVNNFDGIIMFAVNLFK